MWGTSGVWWCCNLPAPLRDSVDSPRTHLPAAADSSASPDERSGSSAPRAEAAIAVLVVAQARVYADGLAEALRRERSIRAVATAATVDEALARTEHLRPDVILVDTVLSDGPRTVQALAVEEPAAGILALAVADVDQALIACVEAGAAGCVTRDASLAELVAAVESLARGETPFCAPLAGSLIRRVQGRAAEQLPERLAERLTPRELEILALIDEGRSNKQIASSLSIELATVKNHVHNILEKLQVARRGEAAAAIRGRPRPGA
jgi:two-component system nitrate/nitrite response regulator NarL